MHSNVFKSIHLCSYVLRCIHMVHAHSHLFICFHLYTYIYISYIIYTQFHCVDCPRRYPPGNMSSQCGGHVTKMTTCRGQDSCVEWMLRENLSHLSIRISCILVHSYLICIHMYYAFTTTHLYCHVVFFCTRIFERTGRLPKTIPDSSESTVRNIMFFLKVFMKFMCFSSVVHATIFPMFGASSLVSLSKQRMWTLWAQENLGSVGFQGRDGIFVFKSLVRDADRAFMALDYYKTYTVNRSVELHNYFATIAEIPQNGTCPGRPSRRSRGV